MDLKKQNSIFVDEQMIDELSSKGIISKSAHDYALALLYPTQNLGLWVSRLLLILGLTLSLSGIIYFFAYNWTKISPSTKLYSIQASIFLCLISSYFYGLQKLSGKILLLSASVLVGVFLAVFGQIYQTGADNYNLFMVWSLLIFPLVILSNFIPLWLLWLSVSNIFLLFYWEQKVLPSHEVKTVIYSCLVIFNIIFLSLYELFTHRGVTWLQNQWTRILLILIILTFSLITPVNLLYRSETKYSVIFGTFFSIIIHIALYKIYRFKIPCVKVVTATLISSCILIEIVAIKIILFDFQRADAIRLLILAYLSIHLFRFLTKKLNIIIKKMSNSNV